MKKIVLCVAIALSTIGLTSCKQDGIATDGYTFEKGTVPLSEHIIKVVRYPNYAALRAAYAAENGGRQLGPNEDLQAFSRISVTTCTIHMIDPAVHYQPEFFGHELVHCLYGRFHPHQNDR